MRAIIIDWIHYLEVRQGLLGVLLICCGLSFLFTGWRFSRVSLVVIFGLVGVALGSAVGGEGGGRFWYALFSGGLCGAVGSASGRHATPILAGLIGSLLVWTMLESTALPWVTIAIMMGVTFLALAAMSMICKRETTILVTSFAGAVLLVSGMVAIVSESRTLAAYYRSMSTHGVFFPFLVLVPTVMGVLLQLASANQSDTGVVMEHTSR